jgi:endonuclease/exonuclease/phosphatase family metal-dependent hydrolase
MSLNILGHATMPASANTYANMIKSRDIDVVGIQEGVNDWQLGTHYPTDYSRADDLGAALGDCYQRRNQVFVNVCRGNSFLANDRFDLTDGPNVTRTGESATVSKGGKTFGFINVHWDHQSSSTKTANAKETAAKAQTFSNVPLIVLGDFNTSCTGSTAGTMKTAASLDLTYNSGIDCIFSKRATKVNAFNFNAAPSDHKGVVADFTL